MKTTIRFRIPCSYWGAVKRWLGLLDEEKIFWMPPPKPSIKKLGDGKILYKTASSSGKYTIFANSNECIIEFEGKRNSFRSGTPFLSFFWDWDYGTCNQIAVGLRDPFSRVSMYFNAKILAYETSTPGKVFLKCPPEWTKL